MFKAKKIRVGKRGKRGSMHQLLYPLPRTSSIPLSHLDVYGALFRLQNGTTNKNDFARHLFFYHGMPVAEFINLNNIDLVDDNIGVIL